MCQIYTHAYTVDNKETEFLNITVTQMLILSVFKLLHIFIKETVTKI